MKATYIYGLEDPRTGLVRYVGKSVNPQERRKSHLRGSGKSKTYCARWICTLKRIGLEPELVTLEGPCEDWEEAERRWIAFFGLQLTNLTSGGDGPYDLVRTPEHRAAIGRANKRRQYTAEMRANMSEAQKARFVASGGMTAEARAKQSLVRKGKKWRRPMSAKGRANIAAGKLGTKASPETRAKMSASHKARKGSPAWQEQQEQNGLRMKQRWQDSEYRARHVAALKAVKLPRASCVRCRREITARSMGTHLKACLLR